MSEGRPILLAAGGTGGHLFPAAALAAALAKRGVAVELATDDRALKYGGEFPARAIHAIPAATPTSAGALSKARAALVLGGGLIVALTLIARLKPRAVVGFGGYPTVPPLLAAAQLRLPTLLHEQNAVMGRANRLLARRVTRIATGFPDTKGLGAAERAKARATGNPVRPAVIAAAATPYPAFDTARLNLLVTGGSQGARVMADVVPAALAQLGAEERARIRLTMQARGEDKARVAATCAAMAFPIELAEFFPDLPARIAAAHLVIGRAGASTVSELAVIGRPSILVPFPHALDQDQAANAAILATAGAASVLPQSAFTPERLAELLRGALADPAKLVAAAVAAKAAGVADAAERLADLVLGVAWRVGALALNPVQPTLSRKRWRGRFAAPSLLPPGGTKAVTRPKRGRISMGTPHRLTASTTQIAPASGRRSPCINGVSAARISAIAAARLFSGCPSNARLAGPRPTAVCIADSIPPPTAMSRSKSSGVIAMSAKPAPSRMLRTRASLAKA